MVTRRMVRFFAIALVGFAYVLASEARAQLVPALTAPLSCTVALGGGTLTITAGADLLPVPHDVPCANPQSPSATGTCSEYTYRYIWSGGNMSHSALSVSADLSIYAASPSASIEGLSGTSCSGDSSTKVGLNVCEQRQIRFNEAATTVNASVIVTRAASRITTAGAVKGNASAYCLIQGPGVPGDPFTAVSTTIDERVAGGKCDAHWINNPAGKTIGVTTTTPGCFAGDGVVTAAVGGGGAELIQDSGGATITAGTGTSSCKVVAGRSYCVCTAAPCP